MGCSDKVLDYVIELPSGSTRYVNADDVVIYGTSIVFYRSGTVVKIVPQENHIVTCTSKEFHYKREEERIKQ